MNCGVAMDAGTNQAVIALGLAAGNIGGFQFVDLAPAVPSFLAPPISVGMVTSENILVDPVRKYVISPNELGTYQVLKYPPTTAPTTTLFNYSAVPGHELDSAAEDCSTGIALAADEFTGNLWLGSLDAADGASYTPGSPGNWTPGGPNLQFFPEFTSFAAGTSGVAIAPGSHLGVVTGEFGGNEFGCIQLPATHTSTPSVLDWRATAVPSDPSGAGWSQGFDPHQVTAYTSPNDGKAYGVFVNSARTYIVRIDLAGCLACAPVSATDKHCAAVPGIFTFIPL